MSDSVKTISRRIVDCALKGVNSEDPAYVRDDYTGLRKNLPECLALIMASDVDVARFMFNLGMTAQELVVEDCCTSQLLNKMVTVALVDRIGNGVVLYFPGFALKS